MRVSLTFILLMVASLLFGQIDIAFSHYMLNAPLNNPSFVGGDGGTMINFQVRNQWTGYSTSFDGSGGAPNSQVASISIPVIGSISGIGLAMVNDNLGPVNNIYVNAPLSYSMSVSSGTLRLGVMPGIFSQTQKFDELRFVNPEDPLNLGTRQTQVKLNLGVGAHYQFQNNMFVGLSATNLLSPSFDFGIDSLTNLTGVNYALIGGYRTEIINGLTVYPTVNVRTNLNTFSFDIGSLVYFSDKAYLCSSYRFQEAMAFLLGYSILPENTLHIGYALDYVINESEAKQPTSQEILLRYYLPDLIIGGRKQVKTPRFTY